MNKKVNAKGLTVKINGRAITSYAKEHQIAGNPLRPTRVAYCVSQAIYAARLEAERDRALIRGYSK